MFDHLKVGTRLALGFGFVLTLLVALWGINYAAISHMAELEDNMFQVIDRQEENALRAHIAVLELRRNEKDLFINAGTPAVEKYAADWRSNHEKAAKVIAAQEGLLSQPEDKNTLQSMKNDLAVYEKGFLPVLARIQSGGIKSSQEANAAIAPVKEATHRLMKNAQDMASELSKRSTKEMDRLDQLQSQVTTSITAIALAALAAGTIFALAIQRSITRPLHDLKGILDVVGQTGNLTVRAAVRGKSEFADMGAHLNRTLQAMNDSVRVVVTQAASVTETAEQLASAGSQLRQSSAAQAESTAAMAAAIEEAVTSIGEVAHNAKDTEAIANEAATYVDEGRHVVHEAGEEMALTATKVAETSAQISDLSEKSKQISGIVGVIREIAEQTNLLALNAAIEAARAGESGRGFAVVADEVRKLAERTAAATTEIRTLIEAVQQVTGEAVGSMQASSEQTDKGVLLAGKAGESFARINDGTQRTVGNIQDIASAAQEQKVAVEQIARNVESVAAMAEQNSAATDQLMDSTLRLTQLSNNLLEATQRFKTA